MSVATELVELIKPFSSYATKKLPQHRLLALDAEFVKWINNKLLADGADRASADGADKVILARNYRKLTFYFHPDRAAHHSNEVKWLETQLSEGREDSTCFKTISLCYEKLSEPEKFKEIEFTNINSVEECRQWLGELKERSSTYSKKQLCDSLISLLDESTSFFDSTGRLKPNALKTLVRFIPAAIACYGAVMVMEELVTVYVLFFLILKGSQKLKQSNSRELTDLGLFLQKSNAFTAMTTTTLLVHVMQLLIWASRHGVDASMTIGSRILTSLSPPKDESVQVDEQQLCRDLALASKSKYQGKSFNLPELKIIAAPFEKYLGLNQQQMFITLRAGKDKRTVVGDFLFKLSVLDSYPGSLEEKYAAILSYLNEIKSNSTVYQGKTARAIEYAEQVIEMLRRPSMTELITDVAEEETRVALTY